MLGQQIKPAAKKILHSAVKPNPGTRWLYAGLFKLDWFSRELYEWGRRSLVATPIFLSRCDNHGENISIDRLPYVTGDVRIELGSNIRVSGKIDILSPQNQQGVLKIGNGVFIGHDCLFQVAKRVEIGDFVSLGGMTYVADNEGHAHYNPQRPIWEVPAGDEDVQEVVIEDNVQISQGCVILKGVRIGARSVIGAHSVVRSDIPPDSVVMGNPARVVKRMQPDTAQE